ncbi:MAG: ABC transporter permease subunit [Chloroflexota bacterium]
MLRSVFGKALWDNRRGLLGWAVGISAVGVMYAAFYPTVNTPEMAEALKAYPPGLLDAIGFTDITSAAGYLGSTTFGILGPTLVIIFAASMGASAIAGDEQSGLLDLPLAHPVSRWRLLLERFAAILVSVFIACAVLALALIAIAGPADLGSIGPANTAAAAAHLALLGVWFAALALAVGGLTGRRTVVYAAVGAIGVAAFLGNNLAPAVEGLAWAQDVSPFHYLSGGAPLRNGFQVLDAFVLAATSAVLLVVGGLAFDRRDIAV